MDIDPQKIDFSKMRPYQSLEKNDRESAGEKISGGFSDYKNNSGASEEERQKYNKTGENNIFAGEKLMSVFGLLALSWKMFKERWKKLAGLALLSIAISAIINIISFILELFSNGSSLFVILGIAIILIFYIPSMLIGIAVIEIMRDKNLGVFETISGSAKKLLSFFITGFIGALAIIATLVANMIVVIGGFLIFGFVMSFIVGLFYSGNILMAFVNVTIWLFGFAAILLMLLPTFVASIWLCFASFAVVLENMSPLESLSYGYELMKKKMLSVVWKNIAVVILFVITSALLLIAVLIPSIIVPFLMVIAAIAMIPVVLALIFIVSPVMYLFQYNIYENLKAIKKDKLPPDCSTKHQGKIKIIAALGALIVILFILFSALSGFSFDKLKDETDMPFGSYFQNKTGEKNNTSKKASNNETLSEIERRDEQRISDLDSVSLMLWHYKERNGIYPTSSSVVDLSKDKVVATWIESANDGKKIPTDPMGKYYYGYKSDGETYELSAVLEDKNDKRCVVEGSFCIYRFKQVKVVQNEEELNSVTEDFSSPEATFNTFLKAFADGNHDLNLRSINSKTKEILSAGDLAGKDWGYVPERELKAKYKAKEKTEKYSVLVPEFIEQRTDENELILEPDIYLIKENGKWKIDYFTTYFLDFQIRNNSKNQKTKDENLKELKEEWRNQF